jgi:hypothetical protein
MRQPNAAKFTFGAVIGGFGVSQILARTLLESR